MITLISTIFINLPALEALLSYRAGQSNFEMWEFLERIRLSLHAFLNFLKFRLGWWIMIPLTILAFNYVPHLRKVNLLRFLLPGVGSLLLFVMLSQIRTSVELSDRYWFPFLGVGLFLGSVSFLSIVSGIQYIHRRIDPRRAWVLTGILILAILANQRIQEVPHQFQWSFQTLLSHSSSLANFSDEVEISRELKRQIDKGPAIVVRNVYFDQFAYYIKYIHGSTEPLVGGSILFFSDVGDPDSLRRRRLEPFFKDHGIVTLVLVSDRIPLKFSSPHTGKNLTGDVFMVRAEGIGSYDELKILMEAIQFPNWSTI
jgi:hypothetical protein